ncbi:MAG: ABC transporter ATP-binding protein [Candidatus Tenebribacter burtonii]|nr:ABC transporter ATP-binding protein [Candidatus Tenebribacter burtonii]
MIQENVIKVNNLTKYYGKLKALDNIELEIPEGRIIGLLGKNGAGKSTFMRCILGFLKHEGEIEILGKPIKRHQESIHENIAFIPDVNSLDDRLTVKQTMDYVSAINSSWNNEKATELLTSSDLKPNQRVGTLSKGMKTKLYLLITLSLDVKVLLLDEPTLGLDIVFRKEFFNTILGEFYDENKTIIISTHQVEEVEQILQDIIFIDEGKIILQQDIEELKNQFSIFTVPSDQKEKLEQYNPKVINKTLGHVSAVLDSKIEITNAEVNRPTLSDLFMEKVGGSK